MPQVDLVSACAGGSCDRKIACETIAGAEDPASAQPAEGGLDQLSDRPEIPPDFPPESFWLSKDAEFDWFDRNAFYERKESTKASTNSGNLNPSSNSNSNSQRFSLNRKSKASIIGLPKPQKSCFVDAKNRKTAAKAANARLFPKRNGSSGGKLNPSLIEPSSPKVSCMGRVRSKRDRNRRLRSRSRAVEPAAGRPSRPPRRGPASSPASAPCSTEAASRGPEASTAAPRRRSRGVSPAEELRQERHARHQGPPAGARGGRALPGVAAQAERRGRRRAGPGRDEAVRVGPEVGRLGQRRGRALPGVAAQAERGGRRRPGPGRDEAVRVGSEVRRLGQRRGIAEILRSQRGRRQPGGRISGPTEDGEIDRDEIGMPWVSVGWLPRGARWPGFWAGGQVVVRLTWRVDCSGRGK
ncbi:uncharacterized protein LOC104427601 [Eucalyptus grandis]|uniref:uncharacterized protein LOC104427601 n=1 Tax=Eucalyptus grandis TaxID=71139 RepID=UPI00192E9FC6|nr:uncharacterized protein LOC104427601 [Eucalyptus grandis]